MLRRLYPGAWGGPNIGGGLLLLLGYAFILVGATVIAATAYDHHRSSR